MSWEFARLATIGIVQAAVGLSERLGCFASEKKPANSLLSQSIRFLVPGFT
jgi:hypothetical protein